ncbi:MAG TPA: 1-acyl-sn-glycerol-3-phosphate acyltransferase [Xanthomonadaceae bacterium]|jgi:1-acyl-sn-glycerol-3-phosphate acyltransferase|nr:1-acyl-sn-glycerol-3-phosphate acyltransferase [Xanthomonadaceae bacterium]
MSFRLAGLPGCTPRTGNAFTRWIGRTVLRLGGWTMAGEFPDVRKMVILAAPHSSAWDAVWGLAAKMALGLRIVVIGKQELFHGPLGWLLRRFGAIPVDRARAHGVVDMVTERFAESDTMWFVLAPEGTRKRVERWKTGFWHIARDANVPVLCAYFHYPERTIGIGPLMHMTGNLKGDMAMVREFYKPWIGKNRGTT